MSKVIKGCPRFNHAFTLVELLLGFVIFSFVGLVVYSTFSTGVLLSRRTDQMLNVLAPIRWNAFILTRELENVSVFDYVSGETKWNAFNGSRNHIQFLTVIDQDLKVVSYSLKETEDSVVPDMHLSQNVPDEKTYNLVRQEVDLLSAIGGTSHSKSPQEVVLRNVVSGGFELKYGYVDNETRLIQWVEERESHYPPDVYHITVKVKHENRIVQHEINVFSPVTYQIVETNTQEVAVEE